MNQLELHKKIEVFLKKGVSSADIKFAQDLLVNDDAKRYFFAQANESWIDWLWENGFMNGIKAKTDESNQYTYRLPELDFLARMAEEEPGKVTDIILDKDNATKEDNFNPEVVSRFIWIIGKLPADQIKRLTSKLRDEKWIYLLRRFPKSGYEFSDIVRKLVEKKESGAILEIAQAILIIRRKEELKEKGFGFSIDNPFYVHDLPASGIFDALVNIEEQYTVDALQLSTQIMESIVELADPDKDEIFDYEDSFALYDVDFFTLELEDKHSISYRDDLKNLVATIKKLIERTVGKKCEDQKETRKIFIECVDKILSNSRSMWRLKLFALAQCPEAFKNELKNAFFRIFEVGERYFEIEGGAEYHQALIRGFKALEEKDKREYVENIFNYFNENLEDKDKKEWRKRDGLKIISLIKEELNQGEKNLAQDIFGKYPDEVSFKPEPSIGKIKTGWVHHRPPVNIDKFSIDDIIVNLKSDWIPDNLEKQFKGDDFLDQRGPEGLGDALKEDIKKRTNDYLQSICKFFDRGNIHSHYLYSLLRGIEEMLRNKQSLNPSQVDQLLKLFGVISESGTKNQFEREDSKSHLADWIEVNKLISDILLNLLEIKTEKDANRQIKISIISYLLEKINDPLKEQERSEHSDLYNIAINSVRGRAFEAFVVFVGNDGNTLADDTKEIFRKALSIESLAVRFVIGRYLATFYFRDIKFITDLLPEIFPVGTPEKNDIYLATWEGYLSNILYDKMFVALKGYYGNAIEFDPKSYTKRKYWKGLDESLAIHIALAFVHLGLEISDPLFNLFWKKPNTKRHKEFVSFIGRDVFSRDHANDEWIKENKVDKQKLINFWGWALENIDDPEVLSGFEFWINPDKEVLDDNLVIEKMAKTIEKSDGRIDWDYGLLRRLPIFAQKNRVQTLNIIWHYLLNRDNGLNQNRKVPFLHENEIKESLKIIYINGDKELKEKVIDLINLLIEKGSNIFWYLKEVVNE